MTKRDLDNLLRAAAPKPDDESARRLDRSFAELGKRKSRVKAPGSGRASRGALFGFRPIQIAGALGCLLVALLVGGQVLNVDESSPVGSGQSAGTAALTGPAVVSGEGEAMSDSAGTIADPKLVDPNVPRQVQRNAELQLVSTDVSASAAESMRIIDSLGGIVISSDVSTDSENGSAFLDLRVPSDRLNDAMKQLSAVATVESRRQSSLDITGQFDPIADEIIEIKASQRSALRQLENATTAAQRERFHKVLKQLRAHREDLEHRILNLREQVDYATITLYINTKPQAASEPERWGPKQALEDLGSLLRPIGGIVVLVGLPLLVLVAIYLGWGKLAAKRQRAGKDVINERPERPDQS